MLRVLVVVAVLSHCKASSWKGQTTNQFLNYLQACQMGQLPDKTMEEFLNHPEVKKAYFPGEDTVEQFLENNKVSQTHQVLLDEIRKAVYPGEQKADEAGGERSQPEGELRSQPGAAVARSPTSPTVNERQAPRPGQIRSLEERLDVSGQQVAPQRQQVREGVRQPGESRYEHSGPSMAGETGEVRARNREGFQIGDDRADYGEGGQRPHHVNYDDLLINTDSGQASHEEHMKRIKELSRLEWEENRNQRQEEDIVHDVTNNVRANDNSSWLNVPSWFMCAQRHELRRYEEEREGRVE